MGADFMVKCIGNPNVKGQVYNVSGEDFVTFDGMAKLCAEAAGKPVPKIVHFDPKEVEVPEGFPKAFPFRGMHFFAAIEKAKRDVPDWKPKYSLLEGLKSSYARIMWPVDLTRRTQTSGLTNSSWKRRWPSREDGSHARSFL